MPAYVIAESALYNNEEIRRYRLLAAASVQRYGGRYLARGSDATAFEGVSDEDHRVTIIEFPSLDQANAWYASEDYQAALATRTPPLQRRILMVDGTIAHEVR